MSQHFLSPTLRLPASGPEPILFTIETRVDIRLPGGMQVQQTSKMLVRCRTLETYPDGGCLLELATMEQQAEQAAFPATLLADISRNNSPLHLRTDAEGNLQQVMNKQALAEQWALAYPWLLRKYHDQPGADVLLAQVANQYDERTNHFEQALSHKGVCAILLPGCYGLPVNVATGPEGEAVTPGKPLTTSKVLHQFFQGHALPLRVHWQATVAEALALTAEVEGVGELDGLAFNHVAWQQLMSQLRVGPWTGPPPPLNLHWREQYTIDRRDGQLLTGRQGLRVAVEGLYHHEVQHTLRRATTQATA